MAQRACGNTDAFATAWRNTGTDKSAIKAMEKGLDDLMNICKHVLAVVDAELGTSDEPPAAAVQPPDAPAEEDA